ncbi:uncharacterized protein RCO7_07821 [Rhynchosporium graminicola]|uniref:mannan endo-1,6-alpha-mannosidase n=1 Tax=Rhynchosporium graminicola TaxID=2792576 RepID=A0A1E1K4Z4_9HELO|nr:uncharacterized protein RCO7_07821 [Rhynchosporium commune]
MDYAQYTGSTKYKKLVGESLVLNSYGQVHDFFGTDHEYVSNVVGRWNDDVEWYATAAVAAAELYGPHSYMPGLSGNGTWISLVQRTIDEVYDYWNTECGGGIVWSTDSLHPIPYKSGITQLEFISLATRAYLLTKNETLLEISEKLLNWMVDSKVVDLSTGTVNDGVNTENCTVRKDQWSYSYGCLVGGLIHLHRATGNSSYLSYAGNVATTGIAKFAPNGVAEELCEPIFLRHLAYLYPVTPDKALKSRISSVIRSSAEAALVTCDESWNCAGDWVGPSSQWYPAFRATHLVASALVALKVITG